MGMDLHNREEHWKNIVKKARELKRTGIWPHVETYLTQCVGKYNLDAILFCLEEVGKNKPEHPMVYFRKILEIQSQNFNEREHIEKHNELKQREGMPQSVKDALKEILG